MSEPVAVRVRDCECPGTPHGEEGDVVFLAPTLSLEGGLEATADIRVAVHDGKVIAKRWRVTFVRYGAIGWNWLDADGEPLPFDVEVLLADYTLALPVSEKANDLYGESVVRPLLAKPKTTSPPGATGGSTSPTLRSIPSPRKRSSPATSAGKPSAVKTA
jgi:hypothetical protein